MPQLNTSISQPTSKMLEELVNTLDYTKRVAVELAIRELYYREVQEQRRYILNKPGPEQVSQGRHDEQPVNEFESAPPSRIGRTSWRLGYRHRRKR